MAVFNFELLRTYSTMFEIEADTQQQAVDKFKALGDSIYTEEMKQCEVIEEVVKGNKYARCCYRCDNGMNEGYFANYEYFCSTECLFAQFQPEVWQYLSEEQNEMYYWTQWEDESDYQYQIIDGKLEEMDEVSYGN
jgi:hypothetical protein